MILIPTIADPRPPVRMSKSDQIAQKAPLKIKLETQKERERRIAELEAIQKKAFTKKMYSVRERKRADFVVQKRNRYMQKRHALIRCSSIEVQCRKYIEIQRNRAGGTRLAAATRKCDVITCVSTDFPSVF